MTMPEWCEEYELQAAQERRRSLATRATLLPALESLGATRVVVGFDGYGDEGAIERPVAFAGELETTLPPDLASAVEAAVEGLLPWGYENNAGAFGEIVVEVAARRLVRDHRGRIDDVERECEEIPL